MDGGSVVEAVVVVGTAETPYRRAGRGATVLILGAPGLFDTLAETLRVVEPLRLPTGVDDPFGPDPTTGDEAEAGAWRGWLQGFVDGLGLDRPALAVGPGVEAVVRQAVGRDPDRFGPVVSATTAAAVRAALSSDGCHRCDIIDL